MARLKIDYTPATAYNSFEGFVKLSLGADSLYIDLADLQDVIERLQYIQNTYEDALRREIPHG